MNIYISNLDSNFKDQNLKDLFQPFGEVSAARIETDAFTGVSRGFGFVEMHEEGAALKAIQQLNRTTVQGLTVSVSEVGPKVTHKGSYKVGGGPVKTYKFRKN